MIKDVFAYRRPMVLLTAVRTGLFDLLISEGKCTVSGVAKRLKWSDRGAEIVLNALCSMGYLKKDDDRYFIAENVRNDFSAPNYPLLKEWLLHQWRLMQRWSQLEEVLKTGKPIRETDRKKQRLNHRNFILSMAQRERANIPALLRAISLEGFSHLLDVGGGPGLFAIALAEAYPALCATIYDTPDTESIARQFINASQARERLQFRAGDFLTDDLGEGYDVALLSSILHIYSPAENQRLLRKVFDSLQPGGMIIIRDFILKRDKTGPLDAALFAVNMLVNTERGNAYSADEIKSWLKQAGFKKSKMVKLRNTAELLVAGK